MDDVLAGEEPRAQSHARADHHILMTMGEAGQVHHGVFEHRQFSRRHARGPRSRRGLRRWRRLIAAGEEARVALGHQQEASLVAGVDLDARQPHFRPRLGDARRGDAQFHIQHHARPHRLQPAGLVDARRAEALGVVQHRIAIEAHAHGAGEHARRRQPLRARGLRRLRIQMHGLRIEHPGEGDDLGLRHLVAAKAQHGSRREILEGLLAHEALACVASKAGQAARKAVSQLMREGVVTRQSTCLRQSR